MLSLPGGVLGFAACRDFNLQADESAVRVFKEGDKVAATVQVGD